MKVYDETPTGRPLPTLQQIRQANLRKILEEEGVDTPCDICGSPHHDYRNCTKEAYRDPRMLGRVLLREGILRANAQIVIFLTQVYVLVHGVTNQDI